VAVDPLNPLAEDSAPLPSETAPPEKPDAKPKRMSPQERRALRAHNHLVRMLNDEDGRAVIMRIILRCNPYAQNRQATDFARGVAEGERRVGTWLIGLITKADPLGYAKLLDDHVARETQYRDEDALILANEAKDVAAADPWHRRLWRTVTGSTGKS
jgi:hypothetical protein